MYCIRIILAGIAAIIDKNVDIINTSTSIPILNIYFTPITYPNVDPSQTLPESDPETPVVKTPEKWK